MSLKKEYLQSLYQTERVIKQTENVTVEIVKNTQTGDLYIKKTLGDKSLGQVYHILKNIDHLHIVKVLDVFEFETSFVVIEEYIQGQTLSEHLEWPVDEKVAINWIEQISNALEFLHSQSPPIIHRDLKPSNIMLQRGQIILIDFDIARSIKPDVSRDTRFIGTSGYAPPEQYGFAQTDTRSDIYALGILFKECLQDKTTKWEAIIKKCTAIDPANRYQTVGDVVVAIKGKKRHMDKLILLIAVAVAVLVVGASMFSHIFQLTLSDSTPNPVVAPIEPTGSEPDVTISQPGTDNAASVSVPSKYKDNPQDLSKKEKSNTSINLAGKDRDAFLNVHKVIYPQFEEISKMDIKIGSIFQDVKAGKISSDQGARRILDLRDRVRNMNAVIGIGMTSDPVLQGIIMRWQLITDSYVDVLERKYVDVLEGRYEETVPTNPSKRDKIASVMSDYSKLQEKCNVP